MLQELNFFDTISLGNVLKLLPHWTLLAFKRGQGTRKVQSATRQLARYESHNYCLHCHHCHSVHTNHNSYYSINCLREGRTPEKSLTQAETV